MIEQSRLPTGQPEPNADQDEATRAAYRERLRQYLQDPDFRAIEGFPIGDDEAILDLSDPPYYTACPNPFLGEIVSSWQKERAQLREKLRLPDGTPDQAFAGEIAYQREPFAADVSEGKNDPIYNAHSYHTKVPHKAIMRYILHYTDPGDVILDAFAGTGMTAVAARLCGDRQAVQSLGYIVNADGLVLDGNRPISRIGERRVVLIDLSPAAGFIAHNYSAPISSPKNAKDILQSKISEVENQCRRLYLTRHVTREKAKSSPDQEIGSGYINHVIWSDVFQCPHCQEEVVFYDAAVDEDSEKVLEEFSCTRCGSVLNKGALVVRQS